MKKKPYTKSCTGLCAGWLNRGASYTYDAMGNIATITGPYKNKKSVQRTYTYDAQNQLLSETIGSDNILTELCLDLRRLRLLE